MTDHAVTDDQKRPRHRNQPPPTRRNAHRERYRWKDVRVSRALKRAHTARQGLVRGVRASGGRRAALTTRSGVSAVRTFVFQ
ncbi:hypothetical protein APASM_0799 [Actinosynnema pretiosum subsp. pretiosum]|nr:hypothetical protein APASM_0799 [Actinosynnema pretiosum subsp. pretiosum]